MDASQQQGAGSQLTQAPGVQCNTAAEQVHLYSGLEVLLQDAQSEILKLITEGPSIVGNYPSHNGELR